MGFKHRVGNAVEASAAWITSQRWYGDKSRNIQSVSAETVVPLDIDDLDAAFVIAGFAYERGAPSRYFLPLLDGGPPGLEHGGMDFRDALSAPAFIRWFMDGFGDERVIEGTPTWRWRRLGAGLPEIVDVPDSAIRVSQAEQSNSSVLIGDQLVVKVFRRLQPGINPDLEIGEFLTVESGFAHAPHLYGLVEIEQDGELVSLAAVQQFVRNDGDGWAWLVGKLEEMGTDEAAASELVDEVALLATRTAEMHLALASDADNEAFAPQAFSRRDAEDLIGRVVSEMEESVEGLSKRLEPKEVEQLHKGVGQLMAGAWSLVGSTKTRVHGDYHLGQTLRTIDGDFCLIDFEGEPSRPISERRALQTPLKDVAGMLRSLDYAVAVANANVPEGAGIRAAWLGDATEAFIGEYRDTIREADRTIIPDDDQRFNEALRLMIVEKALYEVRYELNNRPEWLSIPLSGIRRLAGIPE